MGVAWNRTYLMSWSCDQNLILNPNPHTLEPAFTAAPLHSINMYLVAQTSCTNMQRSRQSPCHAWSSRISSLGENKHGRLFSVRLFWKGHQWNHTFLECLVWQECTSLVQWWSPVHKKGWSLIPIVNVLMKWQCLNNLLPEIHAKAKHFSIYQNSQFHCECLTGENKESEEVGLQDSLHRISYHTRLERQIQADSRTIMHIHTQVMSCHQNHIVLKLKPLVQCAHM